MKIRRTATEAWGVLRTVICIFVAVLIFLISFPSFAAEESGTEDVPKTEAAIAADENKSDYMEENIEKSEDANEEVNVQEESAETSGEDEKETVAEDVQTGYVTMKAVSGNTSITN